MKRTYVSFDVFDTCLIRRCGLPYKIWDLMADRLFGVDDSRGRLSFVGNRSCVEEMMSKETPFPNLNEIYTRLNVSQWGFTKELVMGVELEIENQELFPNPEMLKTVNEYREKGFTIAFISDMYLPTEFIRGVLIKYGFCKENDRVFVSAEYKAGKYDGTLFDYVLKETGTDARQWIHFGDNERSDYCIPQSKGIKANRVKNTGFTEEEKRWIDDARFYTHKHEIELWAGLCRLVRLQNEKNFATTMAIDFVASVYVPYVYWIFDKSKKEKIKKLFFLGRDGHIFYEIAKIIKTNSLYEEIEIKYIKISRRVIYSCMFIDGSLSEFQSTLGNSTRQTVEELLNQIDVNYEKLSSETKNEFSLKERLSDQRLAEFIKIVAQNDCEMLKRTASEKRALLLAYLQQEGALCDSKVAMVDLGWYGSCRVNLNYILKKNGYNGIPTFYWGVYDRVLCGSYDDVFYVYQHNFVLDKKYSDLLPQLMEHYASMNIDGSAYGYERENGKIEVLENTIKTGWSSIVRANERMSSLIAQTLSKSCASAESFYDVFLCCGLKQLERIWLNPTDKEIDFFSVIERENFGVNYKMILRLTLKDFLAKCIWNAFPVVLWQAAAMKKTFGVMEPFFERFFAMTSSSGFAKMLRKWWDG